MYWASMIFVWSVCSTFFTPLEFGFFRGLPEHLQDLDCAQAVFLADVVLQFFVAYRDVHTFKLVRDRKSIALHYMKGSFALDLLGCFPWDAIYKVLIGNMTALIVKGSKTERFRDKMTDLIKYMNRNKLGKEISSQIKNHLLLHYESSDTKYSVVEDIPVAIRSKISQTLFMDIVQEVQLFQGCSDEFLNQIVMKLNEEFFLPGEVILEQGSAADQIYIVSHGILEEAAIGKDGCQKSIAELKPYDVFGDVAVLCNTQQPYTVRVCELCKLLRIEKQSLTSIFQLYFNDSRKVLSNLLKGKGTALRIKHLESDITYLIAKQEAELVLRANNAAYHGDLYALKGLINSCKEQSNAEFGR